MIRLLSLAAFILLATSAQAQCKGFAKKVCRPLLTPYSPSGQINNAELSPGDVGEIMLTFYSRQSYRILICDDGNLGVIPYKILDKDRQVIYDSETDEHKKRHFDFKLASTQQLILIISAPEDNLFNSNDTACVSVIVGYRE